MDFLKSLFIFCLFYHLTSSENSLTDMFDRIAFVRNIAQNDNPLQSDTLSNSGQMYENSNRNLNLENTSIYNRGKDVINDRNSQDRSQIISPYEQNINLRQINSNQGFTNQNVYTTERNDPSNTYNNGNNQELRNNNNERNLNNQFGNTNDKGYRFGVTEGNNGIQNGGTDRNVNTNNLNTERNTNQNIPNNDRRNNDQNKNSNINFNSQSTNIQNGFNPSFLNSNNRNNERNLNTNSDQESNRNANNFSNQNTKVKTDTATDIPDDLSNMTTTEKSIWTSIGRGIQKEIRDIKHPVEQGITSVVSSQCSNVKRLVGVAYEQIEGEKEPDLNQLALTFRTRTIKIIYNITTAARLIPEAHNYNPKQKLYIFIHGFTDDPYKNSFGNISEALLKQGECNVLALDGSSLIHWLYLRSTTYVRFMGEKLGEVLAAMVQDGVDPSSIHIIGHSLGAHISGFTGKTFQSLTGQKLGRISGLDPAGPCFSHVDEELRLNATDAEFVDAMHTDAGVFGIKDPVGQVDYFPNEGYQQPNCVFQTCSHSRAWLYYAESVINPRAFPAVKCADWNGFKKGQCGEVRYTYCGTCGLTWDDYMGFPSKPGTVGSFYLQTGEDSPYGKGENGTKFTDDESIVKKVSGLFG